MAKLSMTNNVKGRLSSSVQKRKSPIHGEGLFATEDIPKDKIIHRTHIMSWLGWFNIVPNNKYNHSETEDNCRIDSNEEFKRIVSIKDIKKGEEIFHDYGEEYWDTRKEKVK